MKLLFTTNNGYYYSLGNYRVRIDIDIYTPPQGDAETYASNVTLAPNQLRALRGRQPSREGPITIGGGRAVPLNIDPREEEYGQSNEPIITTKVEVLDLTSLEWKQLLVFNTYEATLNEKLVSRALEYATMLLDGE